MTDRALVGRTASPYVFPRMLRSRRRRPASLPEPCQPTAAAKPPSGPDWIHEIKYDGYRMMGCAPPAAHA
jgi:hypothetical protein